MISVGSIFESKLSDKNKQKLKTIKKIGVASIPLALAAAGHYGMKNYHLSTKPLELIDD